MSKLNVLVCGSTGYIGIELIKILAKHKKIYIKYLCGNSSVGKNISFYDKSLSKKKLPIIRKFQRKLLKEVDVIFSALPNGEAQKLSKFLLDKNLLIDLSADFRLKNKNAFVLGGSGLIGKEIVNIDPNYFRPTEVDLLIGDATKAKEKLGWKAEIHLEELIQEMILPDLKLIK